MEHYALLHRSREICRFVRVNCWDGNLFWLYYGYSGCIMGQGTPGTMCWDMVLWCLSFCSDMNNPKCKVILFAVWCTQFFMRNHLYKKNSVQRIFICADYNSTKMDICNICQHFLKSWCLNFLKETTRCAKCSCFLRSVNFI